MVMLYGGELNFFDRLNCHTKFLVGRPSDHWFETIKVRQMYYSVHMSLLHDSRLLPLPAIAVPTLAFATSHQSSHSETVGLLVSPKKPKLASTIANQCFMLSRNLAFTGRELLPKFAFIYVIIIIGGSYFV
jgi:hypothetical protein